MSDNLQVEPVDLFYNTVSEMSSESDNPSEPEKTVNDEPEEELEDEAEAEADDKSEDDESEESDGEDFLFTIDDENITEETVLTWKQAYEDRKSMQADYTRKQQARAKEINERVEEIRTTELAEISALKATLEELLSDDKDLDELLEWDTDEYKKERSRREKRDKALEKAKRLTTEKPALTEEKAAEVHNELVSMHSEWVNGDEFTNEYKEDMKLLTDYIKNVGLSTEEYQSSFNVKTLEAFIKAAKYDNRESRNKQTKARLKPVIKSKVKSKPKAKAEKSLTDYFYN